MFVGAVRRAAAACGAALVLVALAGCQSVADRSMTAPTSSTSAPALPPPSGPGCANLIGGQAQMAKLAEEPLSEALTEIPAAQVMRGYLVANASLHVKLDKARGMTVFVPTYDAFQALGELDQQQLLDPKFQQSVLEYSIVPMMLGPDELVAKSAQGLPTLHSGSATLSAAAVDGTTVLNGSAHAVCSAVPFAGGLLYLIDQVLLPPA